MRPAVRRVLYAVCALALVTFLATAAVASVLLQASATAPPSVEPRPMQYDESPDEVLSDALYNLQVAEYTLDVRTVDTGDRASVPLGEGTGRRYDADGPVTTLVMHVEVDNPARRYSSRLSMPVFTGSRDAAIRFYAESPFVGYQYTPPGVGETSGWQSDRQLGYHPVRNQLRPTADLRGANATVIANNQTTYVARIDDDWAATTTGHMGTPGVFGTTIPPLSGAEANFTVVVDKRTGHVQRAIYRYYHAGGDRAITTTYEFSDYGDTDVERPLGTLPPSPRTVLYRLDLGLWAVDLLDWLRVALSTGAFVGYALVLYRTSGRWSSW